MSKKCKYDFIFSIGGACCCTQSLRNAGLQYASFPWDWVAWSDIRTRINQIAEDFVHWLPRASLKQIVEPQFTAGDVYQNELTGMVFAHDFPRGGSLAADYDRVAVKYQRRREHLYRLIAAAKRVLVVWVDVKACPPATDADREYVLSVLRRKWPAVEFDLLTFAFEPGRSLAQARDEAAGGVRKLTFDYQDKKQPEWVADDKLLGRWLKSQYEVVDYRTDEERANWKKAARRKEYGRYHATGFGDYLRTKLEYKLYVHLRKRLLRKGLI